VVGVLGKPNLEELGRVVGGFGWGFIAQGVHGLGIDLDDCGEMEMRHGTTGWIFMSFVSLLIMPCLLWVGRIFLLLLLPVTDGQSLREKQLDSVKL
jgi:hypothetical protein